MKGAVCSTFHFNAFLPQSKEIGEGIKTWSWQLKMYELMSARGVKGLMRWILSSLKNKQTKHNFYIIFLI